MVGTVRCAVRIAKRSVRRCSPNAQQFYANATISSAPSGAGTAQRTVPTIEKFPWRVNAESLTCIQLNHEFCYE